MSDASYVPIGASLTVKQAVDAALGFLYDPNQAVFEIDSDADWRLLHIRCSRDVTLDPAAQWGVSLENAKLTDLQKIYTAGQAEYDPPRIVCNTGDAVPETTLGANSDVFPPVFEQYAANNPIEDYPYPQNIKTADGGENPLSLQVQKTYSLTIVQEVGTYIFPIAYHRNTQAGVDVRQVLRSDLAFWPMPRHAVWSQYQKIIGLNASTILPPPAP